MWRMQEVHSYYDCGEKKASGVGSGDKESRRQPLCSTVSSANYHDQLADRVEMHSKGRKKEREKNG